MLSTWNYPLIAVLATIVITQLLKYPLAFIFNRERANLHIINKTGGMPSSHSAAATALITALTLQDGLTSPYVAIAVTLGAVVMFDSIGVRRQCGDQGVLATQMLDIVKELVADNDNPELKAKLQQLDSEQLVIASYLGHRPIEVIGGIILGIAIAVFVQWLIGVA